MKAAVCLGSGWLRAASEPLAIARSIAEFPRLIQRVHDTELGLMACRLWDYLHFVHSSSVLFLLVIVVGICFTCNSDSFLDFSFGHDRFGVFAIAGMASVDTDQTVLGKAGVARPAQIKRVNSAKTLKAHRIIRILKKRSKQASRKGDR